MRFVVGIVVGLIASFAAAIIAGIVAFVATYSLPPGIDSSNMGQMVDILTGLP